MEVGCLRHPGASAVGSQLQDRDLSRGLQMLETKAWTPMRKGRQAHVTLNLRRKEGGKEGGDAWRRAPLQKQRYCCEDCQPVLIQEHMDPGACTYQGATDNYGNAAALWC